MRAKDHSVPKGGNEMGELEERVSLGSVPRAANKRDLLRKVTLCLSADFVLVLMTPGGHGS